MRKVAQLFSEVISTKNFNTCRDSTIQNTLRRSQKQEIYCGCWAADNEFECECDCDCEYDDVAKRNDYPFQPMGLYMWCFCSAR